MIGWEKFGSFSLFQDSEKFLQIVTISFFLSAPSIKLELEGRTQLENDPWRMCVISSSRPSRGGNAMISKSWRTSKGPVNMNSIFKDNVKVPLEIEDS